MLDEEQKASIRLYTGWSVRFGQVDSRLERALLALDSYPEHEAQITNPIGGDPPGILAQLVAIDAKLVAAHARLKADKVGSIELNRGEMSALRSEGRRFVLRLCSLLSVPRASDVFGTGGGGGDNYVGK